jgi:hypothetical protein
MEQRATAMLSYEDVAAAADFASKRSGSHSGDPVSQTTTVG